MRKYYTERKVVAGGMGGQIIEVREYFRETGKMTFCKQYYEGKGAINKFGDEVEKVAENIWKRKQDGMLIVFVEREHSYCYDDDVGYCSESYPAVCLPINQVPDNEKLRVASVLKRAGFNTEAERMEKEWREWKEREREKERKRWEEERRKQTEVSEKLKQMMETIEYKVRTKMIAFWNNGDEEIAKKENKEAEGKEMIVTLDAEGNKAVVIYDEQGNILAWKLLG